MNDRDMYYGGYGYSGFMPVNSFQPNLNTQPQTSNYGIPNNYTMGIYNDMNERLERLERQLKRLDQRLTRIETPYSNSSDPDNSMYIM